MYTLPKLNLSDITTAYHNVDVHVDGFWSAPISIRIQRDLFTSRADDTAAWKVEVTHSSGGYERNYNQLDAESNFAFALTAAVAAAREFMSKYGHLLEPRYQAIMEQWRQEAAAEAAAKQAAIDAVPAVGDKIAGKYISDMFKTLKDKDADGQYTHARTVTLTGVARGAIAGEYNTHKIEALRLWNGAVQFRIDGTVASRQAARAALADLTRDSVSYQKQDQA